MVKACCVYGCSNRSSGKNKSLAFHRLPRDPKLLKKWLLRMRTDNVRVNSNTRVCGEQFPVGRRSGPSELPSIFSWTKKPKRKPPAERRTLDSSATRRKRSEKKNTPVEEKVQQQQVEEEGKEAEEEEEDSEAVIALDECSHEDEALSAGDVPSDYFLLQQEVHTMRQQLASCQAQQDAFFRENESLKSQVQSLKEKEEIFIKKLKASESENGCIKDEICILKDRLDSQVGALKENEDRIKALLSENENLKSQVTVLKEKEIYVEKMELADTENGCLKDEIYLIKEQVTLPLRFSITRLKGDDALVRFYTGLPSYAHFSALAEFLSHCSSTMALCPNVVQNSTDRCQIWQNFLVRRN